MFKIIKYTVYYLLYLSLLCISLFLLLSISACTKDPTVKINDIDLNCPCPRKIPHQFRPIRKSSLGLVMPRCDDYDKKKQ